MLYIVIESRYDCLVYSNTRFAFLICLKFIVILKSHKERVIELEMPIAVEHTNSGYFIDKAPNHPLETVIHLRRGE